jgi:hypothetical protein
MTNCAPERRGRIGSVVNLKRELRLRRGSASPETSARLLRRTISLKAGKISEGSKTGWIEYEIGSGVLAIGSGAEQADGSPAANSHEASKCTASVLG